MINVVITKSPDIKKRYRIYFIDYHMDIGSAFYENYTMHNDEARKTAYLKRHQPNEDWANFYTRGFWARWLLWNEKTIKEAIKFIEKKFKMKILLIK
jgi:hypothetical protein